MTYIQKIAGIIFLTAIAFFFGAIDVVINEYDIAFNANLLEANAEKDPEEKTEERFLQKEIEKFPGVIIENTYYIHSLFGIVPLEGNGTAYQLLEKSEETTKEFARIYEIQSEKEGFEYFSIKKSLQNLYPKVTQVNETNTYGRYSFYFNPPGRKNTVFLVVQDGKTTWGFQYPKSNEEKIKTFVTDITQKTSNEPQ